MSHAAVTPDPPDSPAALRADTILGSVCIILALAAVQRLVGFVRAVLFCRWLDAEQLGLWDMTFSFLVIAAPLAVISLPGAFGRYLEHYRQRGQLGAFLRRSGRLCAVFGAASCVTVVLVRKWISLLLFGSESQSGLVALAAGCLAAVLVFNFLVELFIALRYVRLSSTMQLINGVAFAALGIGLLWGRQCTAESVLLGYGGSCLIAALAAVWFLPVSLLKKGATAGLSSSDGGNSQYFTAGQAGSGTPTSGMISGRPAGLWSKVVPFAAWVLAANLLANLFGAIDRYLIIHFSGASAEGALDMVGNYHASRVVPLLLVSIAGMLAAVITPHLSRDWESGRRDLAAFRLRLLLKVFGLGMFATAAAAVVLAPLLFDFAFKGKYPAGAAVFPWALVYCCWFGMLTIAQNYLYCAEKARYCSAALLGGLALSVPLNLLLLPRWGLPGAVLATAAANALALGLICFFNRRLGFRLDGGARLVLALPMVVCLGPWTAALTLALVAAETVWGTRLFTPEEKRHLAGRLGDFARRTGLERWISASGRA